MSLSPTAESAPAAGVVPDDVAAMTSEETAATVRSAITDIGTRVKKAVEVCVCVCVYFCVCV